jgi:hypothetical protein
MDDVAWSSYNEVAHHAHTLFDDVAWSDWSNVDFHALETCHAHPVRNSGLMTWRGQVLATGLIGGAGLGGPRVFFFFFPKTFPLLFMANSNWPADLMARITEVNFDF